VVRHTILSALSSVSLSSRLSMISNIEECIAQIMAVHHSNDSSGLFRLLILLIYFINLVAYSLARAMAVLAFGNFAPIIADNVRVQHALLRSLNSHHACEQSASIETIRLVARFSPQFCSNLLDNLVQLLEGDLFVYFFDIYY
jgi:hypothetical protein